MGGDQSQEDYTPPTDQPPWWSTDNVIRFFGDRRNTAYQRNQLQDEELNKSIAEQRAIVPDTGAAKYWYVDPRAPKNFDPMAYDESVQNHEAPNDPQSEALNQLAEALNRIGTLPQGTKPGF